MEEYLQALMQNELGFPVAWGSLGEGTGTPRAVMFHTGGADNMTMEGPDVTEGRVQVDCYGKTYAEAITASRDVRRVLGGYRGGPILGSFLQAIRDMDDDDAGLLHRISLTFSMVYREPTL